jgi:hydroxymethylpyrimidine/phosphomethylpyrimidine kinase
VYRTHVAVATELRPAGAPRIARRVRPVVLTIAGSDSSGGAGIQADQAAIVRLGGHAATVVTAVTAQSMRGVTAIHAVPDDVVDAQLAAVLGDLPVAAVKTGMLATPGQVRSVARALGTRPLPLVVDPVMVATAGDRLAGADVVAAILAELVPRAALVTPNLAEAAALAGRPVGDPDEMAAAGRALLERGAAAVLVKGGHLSGRAIDVLVTPGVVVELEAPSVAGPAVHGTGCALSAAIAVRLAHGEALLDAVRDAKAWLTSAIEASADSGGGARLLGVPTRRSPIEVRERTARPRRS